MESMIDVTGDLLIGAHREGGAAQSFQAINPTTGLAIEPSFSGAGPAFDLS